MKLDDFCNNEVPDFTPLGGNRPDCAVVMSVAVSLVDNQQQKPPCLLAQEHQRCYDLASGAAPEGVRITRRMTAQNRVHLPPDVLDTAMAAVCATVIVHSASEVVSPPHGSRRGGRLSCWLEVGPQTSLNVFCYEFITPWRYYDSVTLKMVLPNRTDLGYSLFSSHKNLAVLDLRHSTLQSVGERFLHNCSQLKQVYLPDTLGTVGAHFLYACSSLVSIDLRNTKIETAGESFVYGCDSLTEIHLPDTLHTLGDYSLSKCRSLVSIDLRNTKLHTVSSMNFGARAGYTFLCHGCKSLKEVHLPDTLSYIGSNWGTAELPKMGCGKKHGCEVTSLSDLTSATLIRLDSDCFHLCPDCF